MSGTALSEQHKRCTSLFKHSLRFISWFKPKNLEHLGPFRWPTIKPRSNVCISDFKYQFCNYFINKAYHITQSNKTIENNKNNYNVWTKQACLVARRFSLDSSVSSSRVTFRYIIPKHGKIWWITRYISTAVHGYIWDDHAARYKKWAALILIYLAEWIATNKLCICENWPNVCFV